MSTMLGFVLSVFYFLFSNAIPQVIIYAFPVFIIEINNLDDFVDEIRKRDNEESLRITFSNTRGLTADEATNR